MCGIVGYSGINSFNTSNLKILFLYNQERGEQASGFYSNDENFQYGVDRVYKSMGKASENLINKVHFEPTTLFIGHTRKSSTGTTKNINHAHPFIFENVVGVHNGTFTNYNDVKKAFKLSDDVEVDSEVFYKILDGLYSENNNALESFREAIGYFEGGAALVASFKDEPNTLYIYRNEERPLYRGTFKSEEGKQGVYLSSLEEGLEAIECNNIKEIKAGVIYTIKDGIVVCTNKSPIKKELPENKADIVNSFYEVDEEKVDIVKEEKIPVKSYEYKKEFYFDNGTVGLGPNYNSIHEDILKIKTIYCETRANYYQRIYYGEKGYFIEVPVPDFIDTNNKIDNIIDGGYENTANLLYDMYGNLSNFLIEVIEAKQENKLDGIDVDILENELIKIEAFLSIVTD